MTNFHFVVLLVYAWLGVWFASAEGPSTTIEACSNGVVDDDEADVDCGSECPTLCRVGMRCASHFDCNSFRCDEEINRCALDVVYVRRLMAGSGASGSSGSSGGTGPSDASGGGVPDVDLPPSPSTIYSPSPSSVDGPGAESAQAPSENTVEIECSKAHEESNFYKQIWLSLECEIEENLEMFWFSVISTVVLTALCIGSICGYNKNTSGRVCCKVCRCGSSPDCAYCCVPQIKCPQPLCARCTCCIDELENGVDGDDDLESVNPGQKKIKKVKIVPLEKRVKMEKRATASVTRKISANIFDFEDFLDERDELEEEETEQNLEDRLQDEIDKRGLEDEDDEDKKDK